MSKIANEDQVVDFVRAAREARSPFEIVAGGTRRLVGRPVGDLPILDVSGLSGVVKYEPAELIITAGPATPIGEIKAVLAEKGQRLGFDPADWSTLLASNGAPTLTGACGTLGGAASTDASGSGRLRYGGARDSLLGFRAVNGLGASFRSGAKVVKNVTGFDLPKLVCGAFGTLCVLTELTFRVYPQPQFAATLCLSDITPEDGFAALRKIALSALEPAGLAYLPANMLADVGKGAALIKLEGASRPLEEKIALAHGLLGNALRRIEGDPFTAIGCGEKFAGIEGDIWRVMIPRAEAPRIAKELHARHWLGDLAGAVLWLAANPSEGPRIREIAARANGQAMLLRGSVESRASLGLFAPQAPALAALGRAVKAAFDPLSLFNPGRL
jgi:glycolate oxidase FAD binding subunit